MRRYEKDPEWDSYTLEHQVKELSGKYPYFKYPPMWMDIALAIAKRIDRIDNNTEL